MRALDPRVVDAVWAAIAGLLPPPPVDEHPLGCHRPRIDDKTCFTGILIRLVVGCSWVDAGRLVGVGQATLRRRRDAWIAAQVFDRLADEAIAAYDRICELDLSEVLIDRWRRQQAGHRGPHGVDHARVKGAHTTSSHCHEAIRFRNRGQYGRC